MRRHRDTGGDALDFDVGWRRLALAVVSGTPLVVSAAKGAATEGVARAQVVVVRSLVTLLPGLVAMFGRFRLSVPGRTGVGVDVGTARARAAMAAAGLYHARARQVRRSLRRSPTHWTLYDRELARTH